MKLKGLLLLQLGTPSEPTIPAVRAYLRAFLSDPKVIDLPAPFRWMLLEGFILPKRTAISTHLYQKIWTDEGSPLRVQGEKLRQACQVDLGADWLVTLGMRYNEPSIQKAAETLISAHCSEVILLPLFPQYAAASTQTALDEAHRHLRSYFAANDLRIIRDYYDHPAYIEAQAAQFKGIQAEHVIISFHGIPVRALKKVCQKPCDQTDVCPIKTGPTDCYRAQCYETARAIAAQLGWKEDFYTVAFQSRLGRAPWIQPYMDRVLPELAQRSIKRMAIMAPSFVADCLETLEEINIRARATWAQLGGTAFFCVPALNAEHQWVRGIEKLIKEPSP